MWTVYHSPADFPGLFVARRWEIQPGRAVPTSDHFTAATLAQLRDKAPDGLTILARNDADDPCIVESWV